MQISPVLPLDDLTRKAWTDKKCCLVLRRLNMKSMLPNALGVALLCMPLIAGICRAEEESAAPRDTAAESVESAPPARQPVAERGKLPPLAEMITSPFGPRRMPGWLSRRGMVMREHSGLDIRARLGWPVVALEGGQISHAGPHGLSGIVVEIRQDDGMTARYAHLEKTLVRAGRRVQRGETVGLVGCTGRTTGAHLHFGLRNAQGELVDPLPYLRSAEQVLRPKPEQIPAELTPQQCGPVIRGRNGRPARLGDLKALEDYSPPSIPAWGQGQ